MTVRDAGMFASGFCAFAGFANFVEGRPLAGVLMVFLVLLNFCSVWSDKSGAGE